MRRLRDDRIELMQVRNLQDWRTHLETLQAWKREGRIAYLGATHYRADAHGDLEAVMRSESLDVQCNENAEAGMGVVPDEAMRARMVRTLDGVLR